MIKLFKNVFDRENPKTISFDEFINYSENKEVFDKIKMLDDKGERNQYKRDNLAAGDFSDCDFFCVDIDNLNLRKRLEVVNKLAKLDYVWVVKESVSGNICVFIKYDTKLKDKFKFVYYKKYLELTLALDVNIDFLPELGRLRYVSNGEIFFRNDNATVVSDYIEIEELPYINTNGKLNEAYGIIYGSGRGFEDEVSKILES